MKQIEKVAIVRFLTDLIKSDTVIDIREIELFEKICANYNIESESALIEAQNMTLSEATTVLCELTKAERQTLIFNLEKLAFADGKCQQSEALLMLGLRYVLESSGTDVIDSCTDVIDNITPFTVFYVESEYDKETNESILKDYRTIENEFRLAGFEFVYIPHKSQEFRNLEKSKLMSIVRHLAPSIGANEINTVFEKICNLTTADFCRSLLHNKLGLTSLYDTEPSFFVKLGESRVAFKPVSNYLKFMISEDVLGDVRNFVDSYKSIVRDDKIVVKQFDYSCGHFDYRGFNKSFFDLIAFPGKKFESRIVIDVARHRILFEDICVELHLSAYERALYVFLLYVNVMGKVVRRNEESTTRVARLNKVFNKIYNMVGKWDNEVEKSYLSSNLSISLSRIKNVISKLELLDNKKLYIPSTEDDVLLVKVDPNKIYVLDSTTGKKELMKNSETWLRII